MARCRPFEVRLPSRVCVYWLDIVFSRDVLCELASVGDLLLPQPSPPSAKRERDSDSPISSTSASTGSRAPLPLPQQQPQRVSISPGTSSLAGGSSGASFVDPMYSHASDAFAQQPSPADMLSHPSQAQTFTYAHLPTHSDELARVPDHVFQQTAEWLAPPQHRPSHQHQHAAAPIYAAPPAGHPPTSYGTTPVAEAYATYASQLAVQPGQLPTTAAGQGQDGNLDIWHTVPSSYECVFFPFYSGTGALVEKDWLIGTELDHRIG
jgi:hypothetical protein